MAQTFATYDGQLLRSAQVAPAAPTGAWGRPLRPPPPRMEAVAVPPLLPPAWAEPPPPPPPAADRLATAGPEADGVPVAATAPDGAAPAGRDRHLSLRSRTGVELALAIALLAGLALIFRPAPAPTSASWTVHSSPVLRAVSGDLTALSADLRAGGAVPPGHVAALSADLSRARRLAPPPEPTSVAAWRYTVDRLAAAVQELTGPDGPQSAAPDLEAAAEGLANVALALHDVAPGPGSG